MESTRWRIPSTMWFIMVVCGCMVFIYNLLEIQTYSMGSSYLVPIPKPKPARQDTGYFVRTPGCSIPEMKPMDDAIKEYIGKEKPIICNNGKAPLMDSNRTSIFVVDDVLQKYGIEDFEMLNCCYQEFHRTDPKAGKKDLQVQFAKSCLQFGRDVTVRDSAEFVKVVCLYNGSEIYKDFFSFVPVARATNKPDIREGELNVLVLGIDAVSRLNLHRQMPKTVKFLESINAFEMLGYNKVGDNTFPNLIPVLSGMTEKELTKNCWPTQNDYFDKCPFLWKNYSAAGYNTVFSEDSSWMGLFYYTRNGFKHQPTDYFWDHFDKVAEDQIGNSHRMNVDQCIGGRVTHQVFLDYASKYVHTMHENKKKFFGFFWQVSLTHDFLNKPKLGDEDFLKLLQQYKEAGVLNNTALIMMSDHGIRWGEIRSTYQGRVEERMPFLFISLPDWYKRLNPKIQTNLKTNTRRLTTPFDLHETLLTLLKPAEEIKESENKRGYSLFTAITPNRTCEDAGIVTHWCTCQTTKKLDNTEPIVLEIANFTIDNINKQLVGYAECATLEVEEVLEARLQLSTGELRKQHYSQDYTFTFRALPSGGIFETTVRQFFKPNGKYKFEVMGSISRLNLYGKQSLCITDFHLKLYCYCKDYIPV